MKEFIGIVKDQNNSCCPQLDLKTRIIGFIVTFILGCALTMFSFAFIGGALVGGTTFATLYTLGNVCSLCSYDFII